MSTDVIAAKYLTLFLKRMDKISLKRFIYKLSVKGRRRKKVQKLLFAIINNLLLIDETILATAKELQIDLTKLSEEELNIARVGAYRILFNSYLTENYTKLQDIQSGDIRDLLLNLHPPIKKKIIERVALKYSFPEWMIQILSNVMSYKDLIEFLGSLNRRPDTWVFVNTLRVSIENVLDKLEREGFGAEIDGDFDDAIKILKFSKPLSKTSLYRYGLILPVSKASIAVVKALDVSPGDTLLDLCAAPGIKTIMAASYLDGAGRIVAVDIDQKRIERMKNLLRRFKVRNVTLIRMDARKFRLDVKPDKILIDAPCTSSGMIGLSPDIKWRLVPQSIGDFMRLQLGIVENIIGQLIKKEMKADIVYSTCSIFPQENEELTRYVLDKYQEDVRLRLNEISRLGSQDYYGKFGRRYYPFLHNTIGLYLTKINVG